MATKIRNLIRFAVVTDLVLLAATGVLWLIAGPQTLYAYGTYVTWGGIILIVAAFIFGMGGVFSRSGDVAAFSITRAMRPNDYLVQASKDTDARFSLLIRLLAAAVVLLAAGFICQSTGGAG